MRCAKSTTTKIAALLLSSAALSAGSAVAQPTIREQLDIEGDFALIGSTLAYDCGNRNLNHVKVGEVADIDNCRNSNTNAPEAFWRADYPTFGKVEASTEFMSDNARTVAVLQLPDKAEIVYARLYWAGYRISGELALDAAAKLERVGSEDNGLFEVSERVMPDTMQSKPQPNSRDSYYYQASADITGIVRNAGPGPYRVGSFESQINAELGTNQGGVASWHMVVFYGLSGRPPRNLTLFDGLEYVDSESPRTFDLDGFVVPDSGFEAQLAVIAYDGQDEFKGDSLRFNGTALGNGLNPTTNFFNATRTHLGKAVSVEGDLPRLSGEPGSYANVDFDVVDISSLVEAGDTSAELLASAGSGSEVFLLGGFVTSVATLAPDFTRSSKTATDDNGGLTLPGDVVEYAITVENTGSDKAVDARVVDPLPDGVTFVPGSIRLGTGADARTVTDKAGDDEGEYDKDSRTVSVRVGRGASSSRGGTVEPGEKFVVTFQVTIDDDTLGRVENQGSIIAVGDRGAPEEETPTDGEPDSDGQDPTIIEVNGCESDMDCPASAPICDTSVMPHQCVDCVTDSQCMDFDKPDCSPDSHTCHCPRGTGNCEDTDDDGVSDGTEMMNGTDPLDADSDDDGALDGDEMRPAEDSDGDGLINGLDADSDNDGLYDGTELGKRCDHPQTDRSRRSCRPDQDPTTLTNPTKADTDGGGVRDGSEDFNFDGEVTTDVEGQPDETDPLDAKDDDDVVDADGDKLSDGFEATIHSDSDDDDSDDDGALDGDEANPSHDGDLDGLVSVLDPDSDDDALYDGTEAGYDCRNSATNEKVSHCIEDGDQGATKTSPVAADTDRGGVSDGSEDFDLDGVLDANETNPTAGHASDDGMVRDGDDDGLSDGLEETLGSDPDDRDSDDDGLLDGEENNVADDTDTDGRRNVNDADSDSDRIEDGRERGTDCRDGATNNARDICGRDADGGDKITSAVNPDTDFGGTWDGQEDGNRNGRLDDGETDPNNPEDDEACTSDTSCGGSDNGSICDMGVCVPGCRSDEGSGCPEGTACTAGPGDEEPGECIGVGTIPSNLKVGGRYGGGGFACAVQPRASSTVGGLLVMALVALGFVVRRRQRR